MSRRGPCLLVALVAGLAWSADATAQSPFELNLHVGGVSFDGGDAERGDNELMVGARIEKHFGSGISFGGVFDWTQVEEAVDVYFYSVDLTYTFARDSKVRPFVGGGAGAATFSFDSESGADVQLARGPGLVLASEVHFEDTTELMVPVGGGISFWNDARRPTWGVRGEVKDNIVFAEEEQTHNITFTGGISFFFGGR